METTKIEVRDRGMLAYLYSNSALTFIGMDDSDENIEAIYKWIEKWTTVKRRKAYIIKGALMNREYGLTGDNAYPDGLTIICFALIDMMNPERLAIPRFSVDGRWFDDVVDNNARFQREQDTLAV